MCLGIDNNSGLIYEGWSHPGLPPMATSSSPTFGHSNSPRAGCADHPPAGAIAMRAAASRRR
jgi:hypothetical protein